MTRAGTAEASSVRRLSFLLGPSILLIPVLVLYLHYDGTPHFFLHSLTGWDVALVLLLVASYYGWSWSPWDGLLPLLLALWALTPDFVYIAGPYHRDWVNVFLFHIGLDEILPSAVIVLAMVWFVLVLGYLRFRLDGRRAET